MAGSEDEDWTPQKFKKRIKAELLSEDECDLDKPAAASGLRRGRKSLKTQDTAECFRTRGPGKGDRSFKLAEALFEEKQPDFVYVCHACYNYFDTEKKLTTHKEDAHGGGQMKKGEYHTGVGGQYKCPTCQQCIQVGLL